MTYIQHYLSPLGKLLLSSDDIGLTGLWFESDRYFPSSFDSIHNEKDTPILIETKRWLDIYFSGGIPDFTPPLNLIGTPFRKKVWGILLNIPYGKTITYGDIAKEIARERGIATMSSQAIGGAVGHNNISIIVPCHRVVGANGNLTGYAGGLDRKRKLLEIENVDILRLFMPKNYQNIINNC